MKAKPRTRSVLPLLAVALLATAVRPLSAAPEGPHAPPLRALLDAPLLFVKRHAYFAGHIYDDYYTWHPGGGIYVLDNPWEPPAKYRIRPIIDPSTPETLGEGVYRDPDLSWDGTRLLFAFKGEKDGSTSIYEIGLDGRGLQRLTRPERACPIKRCEFARDFPGHHDIAPCYLPDGRIAFTSTRARARVPCFNSGVDVLHTMAADGSDIRCLSVNNVNEFDPAVLPDGRILFGRWEYVDKTALYMQSLWTVLPDGTNETAFFANNLAKPTALLDARPVPDSHLVVASLTPHNGQTVGAIAMIDPRLGKNELSAITNFTPEFPTEMDQGLKRGCSDPWPLSEDAVLISNNTKGHSVIQLVTRFGRRETVLSAPEMPCYAPMLVKQRLRPPVIAECASATSARFFVQDVYRGLPGVVRGSIKRIRVNEETARVSEIPPGGRWWNQAFLVSWQGAYTVKNILGTVPVHPDGSAYFDAPPGKALYFQALDAEGRVLQSMRTFVQARPGVTRSCVGCHEPKAAAPAPAAMRQSSRREPDQIQPESWGSGYVDYASMVQPVLDRHCVSCHGGSKGIANGIDLSGGWTWAFNISYETLIRNTLTGFLNCNNGSVHTAKILPPRTHGSGAAPLSTLLLNGHAGRIHTLRRSERDLLMAWMDTNCNYYGTWNWTPYATCDTIHEAGSKLAGIMREANCTRCHDGTIGNDWINLRTPRFSRILRAPLAKGGSGHGLAWCRERPARKPLPLVNQRMQPPDIQRPARTAPPDLSGELIVPFASTQDAAYRAMLEIIERARDVVLTRPRVDLPGAAIRAGRCRQLLPAVLPAAMPPLTATVDPDGAAHVQWPVSAALIGLDFHVHRLTQSKAEPTDENRIATTAMFTALDPHPPSGPIRYVVIPTNGVAEGKRAEVNIDVPTPSAVPLPATLRAQGAQDAVELTWDRVPWPGVRYQLRRIGANGEPIPLTPDPICELAFSDFDAPPGAPSHYALQVLDRRGRQSALSPMVSATPLPSPREPVFVFPTDGAATARLLDGHLLKGKLHGKVAVDGAELVIPPNSKVTVPFDDSMSVRRRFSVECRVFIRDLAQMPVLLACGNFAQNGWFLQAFNGRWRWHLAGTSCDGGNVRTGTWVHVIATYDKEHAMIYQDGKRVARVPCPATLNEYKGPLIIGQYTRPGEAYQVIGRVADVRIYHRALPPQEIAVRAAISHRSVSPRNGTPTP